MDHKGVAAAKPEVKRAREIHFTFDSRKYRIKKLVNVLRVKDFGNVDIGDVLLRQDVQAAMDQGIKVIIDDGQQYKPGS